MLPVNFTTYDMCLKSSKNLSLNNISLLRAFWMLSPSECYPCTVMPCMTNGQVGRPLEEHLTWLMHCGSVPSFQEFNKPLILTAVYDMTDHQRNV